jgi:hypothetical protein
LLLGAGLKNVVSDDVAETDAQATTVGVHGLDDAHVVTDISTGTAVLLRYVGQNQTQIAGLEPGAAVRVMLLTPGEFIGLQVLLAKALDHVVELQQVFGHPGGAVIVQHVQIPRVLKNLSP